MSTVMNDTTKLLRMMLASEEPLNEEDIAGGVGSNACVFKVHREVDPASGIFFDALPRIHKRLEFGSDGHQQAVVSKAALRCYHQIHDELSARLKARNAEFAVETPQVSSVMQSALGSFNEERERLYHEAYDEPDSEGDGEE